VSAHDDGPPCLRTMQPAVGDQTSQSSAEQSSQPEPREFLALVDELEIAAAGRSLEGSARLKCLAAPLGYPRGFAIVAQRALQEADRNPIGLLLWSIGRNQHKKAQLAAERADEIEATYAHLFGEHLERSRSALEAFDASNSEAYGQGSDTAEP
jgi:hypothetical protein